jgi:hypothetical protein
MTRRVDLNTGRRAHLVRPVWGARVILRVGGGGVSATGRANQRGASLLFSARLVADHGVVSWAGTHLGAGNGGLDRWDAG